VLAAAGAVLEERRHPFRIGRVEQRSRELVFDVGEPRGAKLVDPALRS
jgi:hypothetical protein